VVLIACIRETIKCLVLRRANIHELSEEPNLCICKYPYIGVVGGRQRANTISICDIGYLLRRANTSELLPEESTTCLVLRRANIHELSEEPNLCICKYPYIGAVGGRQRANAISICDIGYLLRRANTSELLPEESTTC